LPALFASDIRLKEDIRPAGSLPSGLPVYFFRYRDSPQDEHLGVMAHEAVFTHPTAVDASGAALAVDYGAIH